MKVYTSTSGEDNVEVPHCFRTHNGIKRFHSSGAYVLDRTKDGEVLCSIQYSLQLGLQPERSTMNPAPSPYSENNIGKM
jgi:hypothetical protein